MRRSPALLVPVLGFAALLASSGVRAGELFASTSQEETTVEGHGFEVQHYALDLRWDPDNGILEGTATIEAFAERDLSAFELDFVGFDFDSVRVAGRPAAFDRDGGVLAIRPTAALLTGELFTAEIAYRGVPERIDYGRAGWVERFGFVAALGAEHTWYPTSVRPHPEASYSVRVTVPKPLVAVANGRLRGQVDRGDATTYAWESLGQLRSLSLHIGDFVVLEAQDPGGLPLSYYLPRDREGTLRERLDGTPEMIAFLEERFGPFPYPTYTVVVSPAVSGSISLEMLTVLATSGVTPGIMAHELAHQWAGHSVRPATALDAWLAEGLASFAEDAWREHLGVCCARLKPFEVVREMPPPRVSGNVESAYQRGGWLFRALQVEVGDEVLFEVLRKFHGRFGGELVRLDDLVAVAAEVSGRDLGGLFLGWLVAEVAPVHGVILGVGFQECLLRTGYTR